MTTPDAANGSKKRKGSKASNGRPSKFRKGLPKAKPAAKTRRVVDPNDLKWESVAIPEMFDDAEGFFGLEELQGVDIVRDGNQIQFVTADEPASAGDEFEGFSDSEPTESGEPAKTEPQAEHPSKTSAKTKAKDKAKAKDDKESKAQKSKDKKKDAKDVKDAKKNAPKDTELVSGGFSMLADMDDGEAGDEGADVSAWVPLGLAPAVLSCLAQLKFAKPTAIQAASIPEILAGHDVIGKASTGSGKTLAFAIPIVQRWLSANENKKSEEKENKKPIALVLSPTRELAHQITKHIQDLCAALAPSAPYVCAVTGGLSVLKQQRQLAKADIVVGTPGRLWEVLSGSRPLLAAFRTIEFLVVDEADRLLSEGHFKEAEEILLALDREEDDEEDEDEDEEDDDKAASKSRQTLVFSATFNKGLQQKLAGKSRYDLMDQTQSMEHLLKRLNFHEEVPKFLDMNPVSQMADRLREGMVECGAMEKDLFLYALLMLQPTRRTLVFANSISSVRRLTPMLQNLDLPALPLHSQMAQKARLRSVERFTAATTANKGKRRGAVLLATDVAARGLDIPGIDMVVHYHVPRTADNYVHRSGRTARAAQAGLSVLLCAPEEVVPTRRLVGKVHGATGPLRSIDIDRRLVGRLRERLVLAKTLADATLAKEKGNKDDDWLRQAADELGVAYDEDDEEDDTLEKAGNWSGRGSGRRSREKEARGRSKAELAGMRAQLRELLSRRINTGVSERYLAGGGVDVDAMLRAADQGDFLGKVDGLMDF